MSSLHQTIRIALALGSLVCGCQLFAADEADVAAQINKANGLLRSGDVDAAVKAYRQVEDGAPNRADLSYNMAVAQYRKGDMASAERLFNQASSADSDALAAKARYNLGNCSYASALQLAEKDPPAAIKGLGKAIEQYRGALAIDPNDADSRANIELASAMIDKLREQDKKQQEQNQQQKQEQQQQKNDQKDQKQESSKQPNNDQQKNSQEQRQSKDLQQSQQSEQQQKQSESSQKNESRGQQGSQDKQQKPAEDGKNQSPDNSKPQPQEEKAESKDSKSAQKESKSQPQDSKSQAQDQNNSKPAEQEQQSQSQDPSNATQDKPQTKADPDSGRKQSQLQQSQSPTQQKPPKQRPEQNGSQQPDGPKDEKGSAAPKGALTAADQKGNKTDKQDKASAAKPEIVPDGAMTTQEAEKMLQAIRDQEMIRRLQRQAAERNQHIPVDRDW